jgi:hypothetical protein
VKNKLQKLQIIGLNLSSARISRRRVDVHRQCLIWLNCSVLIVGLSGFPKDHPFVYGGEGVGMKEKDGFRSCIYRIVVGKTITTIMLQCNGSTGDVSFSCSIKSFMEMTTSGRVTAVRALLPAGIAKADAQLI